MEFDYKRLWNKKIGKFELGEEMEKDIFRPFMSVGKKKKNAQNVFVYKNVFLYSLPSSKFTFFLILFTNMTLSFLILDSSMQDAC